MDVRARPAGFARQRRIEARACACKRTRQDHTAGRQDVRTRRKRPLRRVAGRGGEPTTKLGEDRAAAGPSHPSQRCVRNDRTKTRRSEDREITRRQGHERKEEHGRKERGK